MTRLILGVDPSKGMAIVGHDRKAKRPRWVVDVLSVKGIDELLPLITKLSHDYNIDLVRVEKPTTLKVYPRPGLSAMAMQKIAVNVGMNFAKADSIKAHCESLGLACEFVAPIRRGTKRGKDFIRQLTGYTGRTNEHSRDAIVIAWTGG